MTDKLKQLLTRKNELDQEFHAGEGFGAPPGSPEYIKFINNKETILSELANVENEIRAERDRLKSES